MQEKRKSLFSYFIILVFIFPGSILADIRIGHIGPRSGWGTMYGQHVLDGINLALNQVGYKAGGETIHLYSEDTEADVKIMLERLDYLVNTKKVDLIIGPSLGYEGDAIMAWAEKHPHIPILIGYSAPEDLTMRKRLPNVIRPGWTGAQVIFNFGQFCAKELKYRRIIIVGQNYSYPWNQAAGFIRGFLENGGEHVERIWHDVEALDFTDIMKRLKKMAPHYDAVLCNSSGVPVISFFDQWEKFGLDKIYPPILGQANVPIVSMLPELGDRAIGVYSSLHYSESIQSKANRHFRKEFKKVFDRFPDVIVVQGYDAMNLALKAFKSLNYRWGDGDALIKALRNTSMTKDESPRGEFYLDGFGNAVQSIYIKKVVRKNGRLMNKIVKTIDRVSQFGPYADVPQQYMAMPPASATYPPGDKEAYMKEIRKYFGVDYLKALRRTNGWLDDEQRVGRVTGTR